jgi:hypothetical protein
MSSQVKKSCQCQLQDKKHQYFSIVSLPTDSVIVDHTVFISNKNIRNIYGFHLNSDYTLSYLHRPQLFFKQEQQICLVRKHFS